MGAIMAERLNAGFLNMLRRVKIRLANGEADDLFSLGFQLLNFLYNLKGILNAQPVNPFCCFHAHPPGNVKSLCPVFHDAAADSCPQSVANCP